MKSARKSFGRSRRFFSATIYLQKTFIVALHMKIAPKDVHQRHITFWRACTIHLTCLLMIVLHIPIVSH